jgi:hypothetical protein
LERTWDYIDEEKVADFKGSIFINFCLVALLTALWKLCGVVISGAKGSNIWIPQKFSTT